MCRSRISCLAMTTLLISTLPALAAEGAIPIFEPTTIAEPGHYVVTRNIASDSTVITIASSRVDIDLNGFELTGGAGAPVIWGASIVDVRIHDGSVVAGSNGINLESALNIVIENVTVRDAASVGIQLTESCDYIVRRCFINAGHQAIHAVAAFGCPGTIIENQINGCGSSTAITECVLVQGGYGSKIRDNKLVGIVYGRDGIRLNSSPSSSVSGNYFNDLGGDELDTAIRIESSTAVSVEANAAGVPIVLENAVGAIVSNNQVPTITLDSSSHSNTISRNTMWIGGSYGVYVEGDRNRIEANVLNDKFFGLYFAPTAENNVYVGNVARGGSGSGCTGTGTSDFCDEGIGNTSNGDNYLPNKM